MCANVWFYVQCYSGEIFNIFISQVTNKLHNAVLLKCFSLFSNVTMETLSYMDHKKEKICLFRQNIIQISLLYESHSLYYSTRQWRQTKRKEKKEKLFSKWTFLTHSLLISAIKFYSIQYARLYASIFILLLLFPMNNIARFVFFSLS